MEDQKRADERIPLLLQTPAAIRFISAEPLLGPIDLKPFLVGNFARKLIGQFPEASPLPKHLQPRYAPLNWVIAGGESGPDARPMHPQWARSLRDQCKAAGVPFFFKQNGEYLPVIESDGDIHYVATALETPPSIPQRAAFHDFEDGQRMIRVGKKAAGRLLDGKEWNEFPEVKR